MISREYMESIGLTPEQIRALMDARKEEERFRKILRKAGIHASAVEAIGEITDFRETLGQSEDLLIEKARHEWPGFNYSENKSFRNSWG